jgi:predicted chitinase
VQIAREVLTQLGVRSDRADRHIGPLNQALPLGAIDTPLRICHFLAQVLHESGKMRWVEENLNYSTEALLRVFPTYFTAAQARSYARNPERIGSRVYANRMGNGSEASGEGYRFRGRGLIQLTGKSNYRQFSQWIDQDVVARPELVTDPFAAHSAVFFWDANSINALADLDDVTAVTRRVNGGVNGLSERMLLLDAAKRLLQPEPDPVRLSAATHIVASAQLNLRSAPRVSAATWLATMAQGTRVMTVDDAAPAGWSRIRVLLNGRLTEGFAASRFLSPIPVSEAPEAPPPAVLPEAHMEQGRRDITRQRDGGRAYPLGEAYMPKRRGIRADTKVRNLIAIVDFLDSEQPSHLRYQPKRATTFCNIYAHDYCYLSGVFLPRVWWKDGALSTIRTGENPPVQYNDTVRELNANSLYDWLEEFGPGFGWQRVFDLNELQAAANTGEVCVIVGQRQDLNRSGHICAVVPEHAALVAQRNRYGELTAPVISQAGRRNYRASTQPARWWTRSAYRAFGFWKHG